MLKTKRLQDILPQIPFSKMEKISDTPFIYFPLGDRLVISNGHLSFVLKSEYLKPVEEYELQLKTQIHSGQLVITRKNLESDKISDINGLLVACGYEESSVFSEDAYYRGYLEIVHQFTKNKPKETRKSDINNIWTNQVSLWDVEDMSILLVGVIKHR